MTFGDWRRASRDRCADAADGRDVVLFDQHGVEQADAVVLAAAAAHGVLLREAQTRQRLARIEDARARAGDEIGVRTRVAVAVPDSVCRKFSAVRSPVTMLRAGPRSSQTTVSAASCVAVGGAPSDGDARVELPKRLVEPGAAAQRRGLACDDARDGVRVAPR